MNILDTQTHERKRFAVAILRALFPEVESGSTWYQSWRLGEVLDVLDGLPCPTLSAKDRKRIEEKAKEMKP